MTNAPDQLEQPNVEFVAWRQEWLEQIAMDRRMRPYVADLVILSAHLHRDKRRCWPSRPTLAEEADCSVDTIDRSIAAAVKYGHLRKLRRPAVRQGNDTNIYAPVLQRGGGVLEVSRVLNQARARASAKARGVAADVRPGVAADVRPKPLESEPLESIHSNVDRKDEVEEALQLMDWAGCGRTASRAKIKQVVGQVGLAWWALACASVRCQKSQFDRITPGLLLHDETRERLIRSNPNTRYLHIKGYNLTEQQRAAQRQLEHWRASR